MNVLYKDEIYLFITQSKYQIDKNQYNRLFNVTNNDNNVMSKERGLGCDME
jgi:hypothetical protein